MRSKVFAVFISFMLAFPVASCSPQGTFQPSEIGNAFGSVIQGLDLTTYILSSQYISDVAPLVTDNRAFVDFLNDYPSTQTLSEKDQVDITIKLGIVQNAPDWITPDGWAEINKFYPDIRSQSASSSDQRPIQYAMNSYIVADVGAGVLTNGDMSPPKPLFLVQSGEGSAALEKGIASVLLRKPNLWTALFAIISVGIIEDIKADQNADCASGGCQTVQMQEPQAGQGGLPPCITISGKVVIPQVTYALVRFDQVPPSAPHYPLKASHYHYRQANQNPNTGQCFWNGDIVVSDPIPGALPYPEPFQ
jgi:hypothetical protein